ncbi:MAG: hypothetical protein HOC71_07280 [Candidatus Latescibacteria bacterium]|jgi:hypothetical protein|nr:hypothetical protein [Candidatus Latescibacterota bacterium]
MIFPFFFGGRRGSFNANYSVNLPRGVVTDVLREFCKSRKSLLKSNEYAGQSGIPILQDDLDKCLGIMTGLVNQKITDSKIQRLRLEKRIHMLKTELSRPVTFQNTAENPPSIIDEIVLLKDKIISLKERKTL